jgi:tRNA-splicing ligase RtcB
MELIEETPYRYRIPRCGEMRVPGVVFASRRLLPDLSADRSLEQVANVATLPGIVRASYAMPDMHWGYGFPIGGVAATDGEADGVLSPGGVGFDISCGVRMLASTLDRDGFVRARERIMHGLDRAVPRGGGRGGVWSLSGVKELERLVVSGARYAVEHGYGVQRDLDRCEAADPHKDADPAQVSHRAMTRGLGQVGSLGSGNHFLEVQLVDEIFDQRAATVFGLQLGQICVMIHCGSRGLGHQICSDHVRAMEKTMPGHGIRVPDRQLACAPVNSPEAQAYRGAMAAAANYAHANRQVLGDAARRVFADVTGCGLDVVYDVSHNLATIEEHDIDGRRRELCVHRKGATRALPPGDPALPPDLREVGQPVFIPGSMGTASYVLAGVPGGGAFFSTCHGAGRLRGRHQAARSVNGKALRRDLERQGITVRGASAQGLAEETPAAYKDVSEVVAAAEGAGLCRTVARLVPMGVVKG